MRKTMWRIVYTHRLTGAQMNYMGYSAWDTKEQAQREITRLEKTAKKKQFTDEELKNIAKRDMYQPAGIFGKDFKAIEIQVYDRNDLQTP